MSNKLPDESNQALKGYRPETPAWAKNKPHLLRPDGTLDPLKLKPPKGDTAAQPPQGTAPSQPQKPT